ncbi:hybrid sensor histidine kinase/response regulator [Bryobacter aggregatus]|uniref:hybrid sensor histidine kinase/response regulator n=1 Tax=Bryobacter aggregatus TaxID=360054 RepID=UPI0004E28727|nr:hybrid sensor histidine kinase/response regulator [Bryobacter aggregatus]
MERADFEQWKPKEVARLLALVETERRYYQEIVANVPVSLLIVGPNLLAISSNRQFRVTTAKKNDEVLGHPLAELIPIDAVVELAQQVVSTGLAAPKVEVLWPLGEGNRPVTVSALPLRSWEEDSESEALLVIQEQVAASQLLPPLTEKQAKAVDLASAVDAMLWEADLTSGRIEYVNDRAEELFGHPESTWLDKAEVWTDRVAPEDRERVKRFYDHLASSKGTTYTVEFQAVRADDSTFHVRETVRVQRDSSGRPLKLYGCTSDITERLQIESQNAAAQKSEALTRLSAKLAHDLNNLLMIIAGYGEELKNSLPAENPLHHDMKEILSATERLYSVTTQLQTYTRRPVVNAKITSIPTFLQSVTPVLERVLGQHISLTVEQLPDLAKGKMDAAQIEQALVSLAHHAFLELGGAGSVVLQADQVRVQESTGSESSLDAGDYIRFSFSHSGTPMSPEARQRILEPWLYSEESVRDIKMGLSTAYQILRQSHGELMVESGPGKGTAFLLYLPMVSRAELEAERALAGTAVAPPVLETPAEPETTLETILVVEDEGGIRALVRKILRRQGYNVLEAAHGEEALRVMHDFNGHIDLLLTDVMMPGMNGVELSYKALEAKPSLKVLFVSGYTDESLLEAGQFPSGTAFLQKPFTLGSLLGKVREVLDTSMLRTAAG